MHTFGPRGVDEDLEHRAGEGQHGDLTRVELEREVRFGVSVWPALVVVSPHRSQGDVEEVPQDAILIEAHYSLEGILDLPLEALRLLPRALLAVRVEASLEELHEEPGDVRVGV